MKLSAVFLFAISLQVSARTSGQTVSLDLTNVPVQKVFKETSRQTGISIIYNEALFNGLSPVTIKVKDATIQQVLDQCLKNQPFVYTFSGGLIQINKKPAPSNGSIINANGPVPSPTTDIHGRVTDSLGNPLVGASVTVKGSKRGTSTDGGGEFELKNLAENTTLVISYTGYISREIRLTGNAGLQSGGLKITLAHSTSSLDEIQIIAYGTTTQRLNVGNVSTVKSAEIEQQPVSNPLLALEGRVPGVEISQANGLPGTTVAVQIRGINSIGQGSQPLYIIDGVPYPAQTLSGIADLAMLGDFSAGSPFSFINPADIESIDILKDADATAIYGSQGANGVVLITTKKGKAGQTRVDIGAENGWGNATRRLKLLNTRQYLDMRYEAFKNDNATPNPSADYDLTLWDTTRYTDWQKVVMGGTAQYTNLTGSLSGGNTNTQYLFSANYHKETLVFPGNFSDQKGSGHLSIINMSPDKRFRFSFSGIYEIDNNRLPPSNLMYDATQLAPNAPPLYAPNGSINWAPNAAGVSSWPSENGNIAADQLAILNFMTYNFVTSAVISYEVLPGLLVKSAMGYTNLQSNEFQAVPDASVDPSTWSTYPRTSQFGNDNIQTWNVEPQLNYTGHIGKGVITALAGTTILETKSNGLNLAASGFSSDQVMSDIGAATSITPGTITNIIYRYNAGFGRVNYNWLDKYLLDLNGRRDGSSRFGPANRFHDFYSIGMGWLFYKEEFIRKSIPALSYGKLRVSHGTTGNDQVADYSYLDLYNTIPSVAVPYQGANGIAPATLYNPDLAWEETKKSEVGLELGFFHDKIIVKGSYYAHVSTDQLISYYLPDITGFTGVEENLNARVTNHGWEFEWQTTNIRTRNFRWTTSFNVSANRNWLASAPPGLGTFLERKVGHPLLSFYYYHCLGVNPITGVYQFEDSHGKATSNPNAATDNNALIDPSTRYFGGLQNSLTYRGIQLDVNIVFTRRPEVPNYLFNGIPGTFGSLFGSNQPVGVLSRWTKAGDVSDIERFSQNSSLVTAYSAILYSDLIYSDGSYIELKNVSLSWQLPKNWAGKAHLLNPSVFIHAQNLLILTKYKGLNPEASSSFSLPPLRVITVGAKLSL